LGLSRRGEARRMHWIWLIIVGAIVGALGRFLHPGSDPMGWILTIVLGIVSLIIAGLIFSSGALQFIVGIIIAAVLLVIWSRIAANRSRTV
jgi:uncharacterized membrane protein YeaQ/YmgE (transglycosylase-associated protein family)